MKIALTTIGSRGDIQPYIALGKALKENGYDVTIVTHPWAKELVSSYKLPHKSIGRNIDINHEARQFTEHATNNFKGLMFSLNFIFDTLRNCHTDMMNALQDADVVVGHGIVGRGEADLLKKPFVTVSITTIGLAKEYWRSKNIFRESGVYLADKIGGLLFGGPYLKFRKEIGAPTLKLNDDHPYLTIVPVSPLFQKKHPNWKEETAITGYFYAEKPVDFKPPDDLQNFLHSGEIPLFITFGSMFHQKEDTLRIYKVIKQAVLKSKSRAVILMPDLDPDEIDIPDYLFLAYNTPYEWLLKNVNLVIHHFGFGTTAEVLKAGLPSIPLPHLFDQKQRATTIHKLGLATKPLNINKLNSQQLAETIKDVSGNTTLRNRCKETGMKISKEKGVEKAVKLINNYIQKLTVMD